MSDLQAALDKAKSEVTKLEQQKTNLTRDITGLRSKKLFLESAVTKLNTAQDTAQADYDNRIAVATEDLEAVELAVDERKIDLKLVLDKIETAKSELKTLQDKTAEQVIELDKQLKAKQGEITKAQQLIDKAKEDLVDVSRQITNKHRQLSKIADEITQAQADADAQIIQIKQSVESAKAELKVINDKIDTKAEQYDDLADTVAKEQTKLVELEQKHDELLAYEKQAKKALKARESALLEGEANLSQIRRRSSVLDNLG